MACTPSTVHAAGSNAGRSGRPHGVSSVVRQPPWPYGHRDHTLSPYIWLTLIYTSTKVYLTDFYAALTPHAAEEIHPNSNDRSASISLRVLVCASTSFTIFSSGNWGFIVSASVSAVVLHRPTLHSGGVIAQTAADNDHRNAGLGR